MRLDQATTSTATSGGGRATPGRISLIVPMLDEVQHIPQFVEDVARQDFDGEVELLVADGGSTDGSPETLLREAKRHGIALTLLQNDAGWVSQGLNACIREATGDLLVRLDCHSRYPPDYLRLCRAASDETGAAVVGGVIVARGDTPTQRAVACAMDSPFGGIGFYRIFARSDGPLARVAGLFGLARGQYAAEPSRLETDTLTFGAFRRDTFDVVGTFDESLRRSQDDEFNLRVRLAGGRVVLDPAIRVYYTPRDSLEGVFRQYYEYGYWKVAVMVKHGQPPGPRSLVPASLVGSVGILGLLGLRSDVARRLLAMELGLYAVLALAAAATTTRRRDEPAAHLPRVIATFPAFHVGYGVGMLHGLARAGVRALLRRPQRF